MRQMGEQMSVRNYAAPLPSGTSKVDIVFPGWTTLADAHRHTGSQLDLPLSWARSA